MLSEAQVTKYQILFKAKFGREINHENAYIQGLKLINIIKLIYKPITYSEYKQVQERRKRYI
jgi:hypothetical protein